MDYKQIRRKELQDKRQKRRRRKKLVYLLSAAAALLAVIAAVNLKGLYDTRQAEEEQNMMQATESPDTMPAVSVTVEPATSSPAPELTAAPTAASVASRGTAQPIPEDIRQSMMGLSYRENDHITLDELSYLTIPYYDFNYQSQIGHMVVNSALAEEVLDIFAELYEIQYPIERMELVDNYGADDYESIEANNTSAFNYRLSTDGSGRVSQHGLGRAIDINPQINPYVASDGTGAHENAREYWSRDISQWSSDIAKAAYIGTDTEIYDIFISRGWSWGGSWTSYRDYQHFEKRAD